MLVCFEILGTRIPDTLRERAAKGMPELFNGAEEARWAIIGKGKSSSGKMLLPRESFKDQYR